MIIYVDGSFGGYADPNKRQQAKIGWGVVALFEDNAVELSGLYHVPRVMNGDYELIAFFEGVLFAHSRGYTPCEVSFYSDDMQVCYAGEYFHGNVEVKPEVVAKLKHRLERISKTVYPKYPEILALVLKFMQYSRFVKLQGHAKCVYNLRVDYLCNSAVNQKTTEDFTHWMNSGIRRLRATCEKETRRWYPPFVGASIQ